MTEVPIEMPSCMEDAVELVNKGRAFVAIINEQDQLRTVSSKGTVAEVRKELTKKDFLSPDCDSKDRMAFLISGVMAVASTAPSD